MVLYLHKGHEAGKLGDYEFHFGVQSDREVHALAETLQSEIDQVILLSFLPLCPFYQQTQSERVVPRV